MSAYAVKSFRSQNSNATVTAPGSGERGAGPDLGGIHRLLGQLMVDPASVDACEERLGQRKELSECKLHRLKFGSSTFALGAQVRLDVQAEELQCRLGHPGEVAPVDAGKLNGQLLRPDPP